MKYYLFEEDYYYDDDDEEYFYEDNEYDASGRHIAELDIEFDI